MAGATSIDRVDPEAFWTKAASGGACWLWQGYVRPDGYGQVGRNLRAHVVAFLLAGGVIPDGYEVDHLCNVTRCVNPSHLEAVTPEENQRRRIAAGRGGHVMWAARTHCPQGHPYDERNTVIFGDGRRRCRICTNRQRRDRKRRARAMGILEVVS